MVFPSLRLLRSSAVMLVLHLQFESQGAVCVVVAGSVRLATRNCATFCSFAHSTPVSTTKRAENSINGLSILVSDERGSSERKTEVRNWLLLRYLINCSKSVWQLQNQEIRTIQSTYRY